jgi:hypothetical protein
MEKHCGRCGALLTCNPAGDCWCKKLPHGRVPTVGDAAACLCRECLARELRAQGREVAGKDAQDQGHGPARAGKALRQG